MPADVTFLHPDLGIGGAERLVVDAALALKERGHSVRFVTTHYDPKHCFNEIKDGMIPVTVVGDWIPRHILGRFHALFAYVRMVYAALYIIFSKEVPEIVICDLVSVCIPILRWRVPYVIYYCHHPDQLLSPPGGYAKRLYRMPLDYLEELSTGMAHKVFVNSEYTCEVFKNTFKKLDIVPDVLYPSMNTNSFDKAQLVSLGSITDRELPSNSIILLSINRYERKKCLSIAIQALAELKNYVSKEEYERVYLIMAGGYDMRVQENVEHYLELLTLSKALKLNDKVIFLQSPSDSHKVSLLRKCTVLLYTPPNEHFGIVPLEAMYAGKPVIAQNSGGPKESIVSGTTGYLVDAQSSEEYGRAFAERIADFICNTDLVKKFGDAGKIRYEKVFSFDSFAAQLDKVVTDFGSTRANRDSEAKKRE